MVIIYIKMANKQKKIIQNYVIQHPLCVYPDSSQYFMANHKILKKAYTIRKVKYRQETKNNRVNEAQINASSQQIYQKIRDQININKRLNGHGALKCHQLIRTIHHLYIVYDALTSLNLREFILRGILAKNQKIQLFQRIIQTLKRIHEFGVIIVKFTLDTIRVDEEKNVIFTDLTCARFLSKDSQIGILDAYSKQTELLPQEILTEGKLSFYTDVLMIGKLFIKIIREFGSETSERYKCLLDIIEMMTSTQPESRLSLDQALLRLQKIKVPKERKFSEQYSNKILLDPLSSYKQQKYRKLSYQTSLPNELSEFIPLNIQENTNDKISTVSYRTEQMNKRSTLASANQSQENNYSQNFKNIGENISSTKSQKFEKITGKKQTDIKKRVKSVNNKSLKQDNLHNKIVKKRNLAFFIFDLSQFVLKQGTKPFLVYLLVKYSSLTLSSCVQEIQSVNLNKKKDFGFLHQIILNQKLKMTKMLIKMVEYLKSEEIDVALSYQLMQQKTISEKLLNNQILLFARQMLQTCEQSLEQKKPLKQLGEFLFKTYMILKKIEIGSYERFWDLIYNEKYASLNNQRYIKQQKQLGFRYLRTKIQEIVNSK